MLKGYTHEGVRGGGRRSRVRWRRGAFTRIRRGAMARSPRRDFLRTVGGLGAFAVSAEMLWRPPRAFSQQADPILAGRPLVRYPEKTDLILMTSRPPQLETPMTYFDRAITPNEAFFVRYHTFPVPTGVDLGTWRLRVTGLVERPLGLSFEDLKTRFPKAAVTAVTQCAGNSRGRFSPRVLGGGGGDGAMGNAEWGGGRLRELLAAAGVRQGAVQATFEGLDAPSFPSVPHFVKSLDIRRVMDDPDVIVAYQMNGRELPMLNGFPARLVVPRWYSTYWVKNLSEIAVIDHVFEKLWMKPAYRIPDTPCGCVEPGTAPKNTVPISRMTVRSFVGTPANGARVVAGRPVTLKGIAFDRGYGVSDGRGSADSGVTRRRRRR